MLGRKKSKRSNNNKSSVDKANDNNRRLQKVKNKKNKIKDTEGDKRRKDLFNKRKSSDGEERFMPLENFDPSDFDTTPEKRVRFQLPERRDSIVRRESTVARERREKREAAEFRNRYDQLDKLLNRSSEDNDNNQRRFIPNFGELENEFGNSIELFDGSSEADNFELFNPENLINDLKNFAESEEIDDSEFGELVDYLQESIIEDVNDLDDSSEIIDSNEFNNLIDDLENLKTWKTADRNALLRNPARPIETSRSRFKRRENERSENDFDDSSEIIDSENISNLIDDLNVLVNSDFSIGNEFDDSSEIIDDDKIDQLIDNLESLKTWKAAKRNPNLVNSNRQFQTSRNQVREKELIEFRKSYDALFDSDE